MKHGDLPEGENMTISEMRTEFSDSDDRGRKVIFLGVSVRVRVGNKPRLRILSRATATVPRLSRRLLSACGHSL